MKKINLWKIEGYAGFYDCDGPSDYNINRVVALDAIFKKEEVTKFIMSHYSNSRVVQLNITIEKELELDIK